MVGGCIIAVYGPGTPAEITLKQTRYVAERRRLAANVLCIFGARPIDRTDVQPKVTLLKAHSERLPSPGLLLIMMFY